MQPKEMICRNLQEQNREKYTLHRCNRGAGVLELAGIIVVFLMLALSGFGIVDLIQRKNRLVLLVERNLNDQSIKSFVLDDGLSSFHEEKVRAELLQLLGVVRNEIENEFTLSENGEAGAYRVELQAAEVLIDPAQGIVQGIHVRPGLVLGEGSLGLPSSLQHEYDLTKEFERIAGSVGRKSPYAYPSGLYGTGTQDRFLPRILLLGMRAFVSFEGTFTDSVVSNLGFQEFPITAEIRVIPLRGEIGGI